MSFISNDVIDKALLEIKDNGTVLHMLPSLPTTFANVTTNTLGNKTGIVIDPPSDVAGGGRKITIKAAVNGAVTKTGTATHWAIVDPVESALLAAGSIGNSQVITTGNTFDTTDFTISIPVP